VARPGTGPSRPLLLLVNFDWALEPPRPVAPSTHFIGPLMPRPPAPLPEDIQQWLDGAAGDGGDGAAAEAAVTAALPVVYLSFGSSFLAPADVMPSIAALLAACAGRARLLLRMRPQERELLDAALAARGFSPDPQGWLVRERFPQNDVLGHPKVAAFVTQVRCCGMTGQWG
jgi:hypothetical protein